MEKNVTCALALNVLVGAIMDSWIFCNGPDGSYIKFSNETLELVDSYGNKFTITDGLFVCEHNAPSYDELYDYWKKHRMFLKEVEQ